MMIVWRLMLRAFFRRIGCVFKEDSVDNSSKSRKITAKIVDKYVDGVDSIVNIHQNVQHIYTTCVVAFSRLAACCRTARCKTARHNCATVRRFGSPRLIVKAEPVRNKEAVRKTAKISM
jgi:hypothetical protein